MAILLLLSGCGATWVEQMPLPNGCDWYAYHDRSGNPFRGYLETSDRFIYNRRTNQLERLQSDIWTSSGAGLSGLRQLPITPTVPVY